MPPNATHFSDWLAKTDLGQHIHQQENPFFQNSFAQLKPKRVLQLGLPENFSPCFHQELWVQQNHVLPADVLADTPQIWHDNTFDAIMLPHYLEFSANPKKELAQISNITQAFGHIVLTGFNPHSLWHFYAPKIAPIQTPLPLETLKSWLPEMGWQVISGQFMNYLPPINSKKTIEKYEFMEKIGNRWFPHFAAIYCLVLRKHVVPLRGARDEIDDVLLSGDVALGLSRHSTPRFRQPENTAISLRQTGQFGADA